MAVPLNGDNKKGSTITLHPGISLNEPNSSDEDNEIVLRFTPSNSQRDTTERSPNNNGDLPLATLEPSKRLVKLKDDLDATQDEFVDTESFRKLPKGHASLASQGIAGNGTLGSHLVAPHNGTLPHNSLSQITAAHRNQNTSLHTFSKLKSKAPLNASLVNDKRQKLLLKANIRKLTTLTLEKQQSSRTRFIRAIKTRLRHWRLRLRSILKVVQPLKALMHKTEKKFGTGIASFFDLWNSIIYLNIGVFIVTFLLAVLPWFFSSAALNMDFLLDWNFLLGLIGVDSEVIGKSWFFYGGYASAAQETRRWNTPFAYALSVLAYYAISVLIIVYAIGSRLASVTSVDPNMKYSTGVLSMWNHQLNGRQSVEALQRSIASRFKEYLRSDELKAAGKKRHSKKQILVFIVRRLLGYSLTIILLISAPTLVFLVTQFYNTINSTVPLSTSIIIVILSVLYPKLLQLAVAIEGYEDARHTNRHNITRTYIVKIAIATSLVIRVLYPDLLNLDLGDQSTDGKSKCIGTEAGMVFWQLVIIDFFSSAASNIFANLFLVRVKALVRSHDRKLEFGIADSVNQVLYRQALIWIGSALCPMLPLLGILSNIALFLIKYIMCKFTIKFPKNPVANAKSSVFNLFMLLITLILSIIPGVAFLLKSDHKCGPFQDTTGATVISSFFETNSVLVSIPFWDTFWDTIRSPLILYICIIVLAILLFFVLQRLRMFRGRWKLELLRVQLERMEKLHFAAEDKDGEAAGGAAVSKRSSRVSRRKSYAAALAATMSQHRRISTETSPKKSVEFTRQKSKQQVIEKEEDSKANFDEETADYENRMELQRQKSLNLLSQELHDTNQQEDKQKEKASSDLSSQERSTETANAIQESTAAEVRDEDELESENGMLDLFGEEKNE